MFSEIEIRVFVGVGANLVSPYYGAPLESCRAALDAVAQAGLPILRRSRFYESAPVPLSDQPWYVNGVVEVGAVCGPEETLALLHGIEARFGRVRRERNEARVIDLDLVAYGNLVMDRPGGPVLPHPRMHVRAFVLLPLREISPAWSHPVTGISLDDLIAALPADQICRACA